MKKRVGALLLGVILLLNGFSWEAQAADSGNDAQAGDAPESVGYVWVNPIYQDVADAGSLEAPVEEEAQTEARAGSGASVTYLSVENAADALCSQMVNRSNNITLYVQTSTADGRSLISSLYEKAVAVDAGTSGREGDYITYHIGGYGARAERYAYAQSYRYVIMYSVKYYTTKAQEAQVTAKVNSVLTSLGVKKMGTYNKIKTIYDYICKNVQYDQATVNDSSLGKFTAYQALLKGKAVCQGYASLFYRMAMDAGVRVRVIPGTSRSVPHAWNIVKLGSYYYNLDSTWDAGQKTYAYFLKSNKEFGGHTREKSYTTASFNAAYPMAAASYKKGTSATTAATKSISKAKVSGLKTKTYTGKKRTQTPTLKLGGVTLKKGQDYTVSYKNNVKIGTATITFKGKGKYSGTLKKTFKITVKKGAVYKVSGSRYRIVSAKTNGKGTVRRVGAAKKVSQVKIGGKKFKVLL